MILLCSSFCKILNNVVLQSQDCSNNLENTMLRRARDSQKKVFFTKTYRTRVLGPILPTSNSRKFTVLGTKIFICCRGNIIVVLNLFICYISYRIYILEKYPTVLEKIKLFCDMYSEAMGITNFFPILLPL